MKFTKPLMLAVALTATSTFNPAQSDAAVVTMSGNLAASGYASSPTFSLVSGLYQLAVSSTASYFDSFGSNVVFAQLQNTSWQTLTGTVSFSTLLMPTGSSTTTFSVTDTTAGNYTLFVSNTVSPVSYTATITAVPGPIAATGIPTLLAIGGLWAVVRRRKTSVMD